MRTLLVHWPTWATIIAVLAGIAALLKYAKQILEAVAYMSNLITELRIRRVARAMEEAQRNFDLRRGGKNWVMIPIPIADIAKECQRSVEAVRPLLLELEKRAKVHEAQPDAWLPGPRPQAQSFSAPVGRDTGRF
jgi:hypothetical protein